MTRVDRWQQTHIEQAAGLPPLDLDVARKAVASAVQVGADRTWSSADPDWVSVRTDRLTEADVSVVRFITFVEDHVPGYLTWLLRTFPVDNAGADDPPAKIAVHREYFRFFVTWAYDEERHAAVLTRYQEVAGIADPDTLRLELAEEGRKHFELPYPEPLEAFTYTMLQEKATQLFYHQFRTVVTEPLLRDLLRRLGRDEARHFAFYSHLVEQYLRRDPAGAAPHLKQVLRTFRMPLADTLHRYRRWSDEVVAHTGYDYTAAYHALERLVTGFIDRRGDPGIDDLMHLVTATRALP